MDKTRFDIVIDNLKKIDSNGAQENISPYSVDYIVK